MTQGKWTPATPKENTPKYLALVDSIEQAIASGALKPDERLPTNRELSQLFDVTIATVTKAMAVAARKGLIVAQVGSGTFVRGAAAQAAAVPAEPLDMSLNILPDGVVEKELQTLLQSQAPAALVHGMFGYGTYVPRPEHARRVASWMAEFGAQSRLENLLLTVGAHQGLMAAFHVLLSPGQTAICEELTYTGIKRIANYRDITLLGVACDEHGMLPDSLEEKLRTSAAKVVVATPALHNPTTATLPDERRRAIARLCRKYEAYLIEDGINMPLWGEPLPTIASHIPERAIFLTGYSKCVASGFRLGYATTPPNLQNAFHEALVSTQWTGPRLYADLADQLLAEGLVARCTDAHRKEARQRYDLASRILTGVRRCATPGYHAWIDAPGGQQGEDFALLALRHGVRVSPAAHFAVSPGGASPLASYRISLGASDDRAEIERALRILAGIGTHHPTSGSTLI